MTERRKCYEAAFRRQDDGTPLFDLSQIGTSRECLKPDLATAAKLAAAKGRQAHAMTSDDFGAAIRAGLLRNGIAPDREP